MCGLNNIIQYLKPLLIRLLPLVYPVRRAIAKAIHSEGTQYCPVCKSNVRRFLRAGNPPRENAKCPVCTSFERHRLDWIFFSKQTNLFDGTSKKMLHVAPEEFLSEQFRKIKNLEYLSADISNPGAMVKMDITDINYADNSFSIIYCSHVLEHIQNDRKAIDELYRVLCQGGWALLQVPVSAEKTYEDPTIVKPEERLKHFGQSDHVRRCGYDYVERIRLAGFVVKVIRATDLLNGVDCARMGVQPDSLIFFCEKQSITDNHSNREEYS